MSFFGLGRRREEEGIPQSSSSQPNNTSHRDISEAPTQPRPTAPPIYPAYTPSPSLHSPVLSPNQSRGVVKAFSDTQGLHIPTVGFNPADAREDEKANADPREIEESLGETVDQKPSIDSYGTAEEQPGREDETGRYQYFEGKTNGFHEHPCIGGLTPSFDSDLRQFATASASESLEEGDPTIVQSHEEGGEYQYQVESVDESDDEDTTKSPLRESNHYYQEGGKPSTPTPARRYAGSVDLSQKTPTYTPVASSWKTLMSRLKSPNRNMVTYNEPKDFTSENAKAKSPLDSVLTDQFKEVHNKTIRRRKALQDNMQDLERRLAGLTSELANITMDREAEQINFLRDNICFPMQQVTKRLSLEMEHGSSPHYTGSRHWMSLTTRMSKLETEMTHHIHVASQTSIRQNMDCQQNDLNQEVTKELHTEVIKSEQREASFLRQFESVAATARRRHHEEQAARLGAFEVVKQKLLQEAKVERDPARIEEAVQNVKILRAKLEQERVERRMRDEHLKASIEQEILSMKRALLEASGGDDVIGEEDNTRRAISYH